MSIDDVSLCLASVRFGVSNMKKFRRVKEYRIITGYIREDDEKPQKLEKTKRLRKMRV